MYWERITNVWKQLVSRAVKPRGSVLQGASERGDSILGLSAIGDVREEVRSEVYIPSNNAKRSESSLHLSC